MKCCTLDFKQAPDVGGGAGRFQCCSAATGPDSGEEVAQCLHAVLLDINSLFKMIEADLVLTVFDTFSLCEY